MAWVPSLRVPVQSRSLRTRAALVSAAQAEFEARGYALTTAKSIADRAGVATGTFYHYFPEKDVVLRELAAERVQWLFENATQPQEGVPSEREPAKLLGAVRRRLRDVVRVYMDYHRRDRGLHAVISERRLCDPALDAIQSVSEKKGVEHIAGWLSSWGHEGPAEVAAYMIFALLEGAVHGHVIGQPMLSDASFVEGLVEAMLRIAAPRVAWRRMTRGDLR